MSNITDEHVSYVGRYGGTCRDCADENGVCPSSGLPCAESKKAIGYVLRALDYGVTHGYIANPFAATPQQPAQPELIKWTLGGDKTCGYSNWLGETPFGRILITWKGWKECHDACVDEFPGGFSEYGSPDDVKAACEAEYQRRACAVSHPPAQAPVLSEERAKVEAELRMMLEGIAYGPQHPGYVSGIPESHYAGFARDAMQMAEHALKLFDALLSTNPKSEPASATNALAQPELGPDSENYAGDEAPLPADVPYPPSLDNVTIYNPYGPMSMDPTDGQPVEHYGDRDGLRDYGARCIAWAAAQAPAAAHEPAAQTALERFNEIASAGTELDEQPAIEHLRLFCSYAMNGTDWLDVEPFFNAVIEEAAKQPAAPTAEQRAQLAANMLRFGAGMTKRMAYAIMAAVFDGEETDIADFQPAASDRDARDFNEIARAAIKYLNDNHHPHTTLIVTPTSAEVVEGVKAMQTTEFVKD